jgi:cytochrome P450
LYASLVPHYTSLFGFLYQVFCCIVIVAIAIIYFIALWLRQLFSRPRPDITASRLPAPRRILRGHAALPVYGHTLLYARLAGDIALLFHNNNTSQNDCFALYIWGRWRIAVKGPQRAKQLMQSQTLKECFCWTPPVSLLGKSCLPFLNEHDKHILRQLIERPLGQRNIQLHAPVFREIAEATLLRIAQADGSRTKSTFDQSKRGRKTQQHTDDNDSYDPACVSDQEEDLNQGLLKVKWEALRSYTFDLVDGPVLGLNHWRTTTASSETLTLDATCTDQPKFDHGTSFPPRQVMINWMERMKLAVDTIKITFGPEWMYIWFLNEYGRGINARDHMTKVFTKVVNQKSESVLNVEHQQGHSYHDPTAQIIPLLALRTNYKRGAEGIFGNMAMQPAKKLREVTNRARAQSAPVDLNASLLPESECDEGCEYSTNGIGGYVAPFWTEQDLARPRSLKKTVDEENQVPSAELPSLAVSPLRRPLYSESGVASADDLRTPQRSPSSTSGLVSPLLEPRASPRVAPLPSFPRATKDRVSVLDRLLREQDMDGNGVSRAVMSELCITLWMMMDIGNAWTAMALHLVSFSHAACSLVQREIDLLEAEFGYDALFTPSVLHRMQYLDSLLYEAIRLCPPFLGGLKKTTKTIEFEDAGVQLPKDSYVFFCQPTDVDFDIFNSFGKKPQDLGRQYPSPDL